MNKTLQYSINLPVAGNLVSFGTANKHFDASLHVLDLQWQSNNLKSA